MVWSMTTPFGQDQDLFFMRAALAQAQRAFDRQEVPIGAVVVNNQGMIVGRGYNKVEQTDTQAGHAEVLAVTQAGKKIQDWRLDGCWVYVTLEPCAMCMHLLLLSRVTGIVYGARSPLFGYSLDKYNLPQVYKMDTITVIEGVLDQEASRLLKQFFILQRKVKSVRSKQKSLHRASQD
jgi:tRNA(adenine34) deaminase